MKLELEELIKSFDSRSKNKKERYNEFLFYCYMTFDKKIKSKSSGKSKNKYSIMRDNTLKYLIANEKAITAQLTK
jgi:hypothetical protein|tara:strand:- start:294 stop:518 length:225 start_codon:yes stop_codon:yes gene_type:complete